MKKILFLIVVVISLASCSKGKGSLTGNVYWKYNDYVGNKPDVGSLSFLISKNGKITFETKSDVYGNFQFTDVPSGDYILIVKSKNTTENIASIFNKLYVAKNLESILGFDYGNDALFNETYSLFSKYELHKTECDLCLLDLHKAKDSLSELKRKEELKVASGVPPAVNLGFQINDIKRQQWLDKKKLECFTNSSNSLSKANSSSLNFFNKLSKESIMIKTIGISNREIQQKIYFKNVIITKDNTLKEVIDFETTYL